MNLPVRFTDDVADLPTHKFGSSSLTWWGVIAFMLIEGTAFALTFAAYFFIMGHEQGWPPEGREAPNLIAGTLFTIVMVPTTARTVFADRSLPSLRALLLSAACV